MEVPSLEHYLTKNRRERSERDALLNDIYAQYDTQVEVRIRKYENITRYKVWLRQHKRKNNPESQHDFMADKSYLKPTPKSRMWFFLSHIPTKDLYYVLSVCRDKSNRGESVGAFIHSQVKK